MTNYELLRKEPCGVRVVGTTTAGTLSQAMRRLYRAYKVPETQAKALGYHVQPTRPQAGKSA